MKIFCQVHGKQAVVVGYGPGRKGRPRAIVISEGTLKDVALKDIVLDSAQEGFELKVLPRREQKRA